MSTHMGSADRGHNHIHPPLHPSLEHTLRGRHRPTMRIKAGWATAYKYAAATCAGTHAARRTTARGCRRIRIRRRTGLRLRRWELGLKVRAQQRKGAWGDTGPRARAAHLAAQEKKHAYKRTRAVAVCFSGGSDRMQSDGSRWQRGGVRTICWSRSCTDSSSVSWASSLHATNSRPCTSAKGRPSTWKFPCLSAKIQQANSGELRKGFWEHSSSQKLGGGWHTDKASVEG